jgi:ATP-dependent helicase/nuclease subunit A
MSAPDEATRRQIEAADPADSAWVSANAGSGKTRVLIDRAARLLLEGTRPEKILCLTYTKAAASEMQNRLFKRLGAWAMLADDALAPELAALGSAPPEGGLRAARRLFARAIEAPGGLKIQTIHAFSSAILRRFPLEAGVPPDFEEMDDRAQALLREEIVDAMAEEAEAAATVEAMARHMPGGDFAKLTAEIAAQRQGFGAPPSRGEWLARFGLPEGYGEAALLREAFLGSEGELLARLVPLLEASSTNDAKAADKLRAIGALESAEALAALEGVLLRGAGAEVKGPFTAKIGEFPTKALRQGRAAALMPALEDLMRRVEAACPRRLSLQAAEKAEALHAFARPFLDAYAARKAEAGLLDFDDLILKAGALLRRKGVAEWVLFRLDGGIDHILVDEAQDTSPAQWDVIRLIAEEFSAGESARSERARTLFVVGDVKQSIYSFQGAEPENFARMRAHFGGRLAQVERRLGEAELQHSFRSAPAILRVVDAAFAQPERHRGLGGVTEHFAFHEDMPGRVDLWPSVPPEKAAPEVHWTDPVDRIDPEHHDIRLARAIAAEIARLCDPTSGETLPVLPRDGAPYRRPFRPGDFLILVQRRSALFAELIRACKAEGLPIAGADRLKLGAELAVKDLAALLSFLATPDDDLSLAAALKSPLFGWSEDRLFRLAHGRRGTLWEALRGEAGETGEVLTDLRSAADFLRPYEMLERILIRHGGRRKLIARLGPEAEDGIDALIAQAMAYERRGVPSLTGFLAWMETEDVEVKRELPSDGSVVRVMTVHGAKGLEAPVVILPDTRPPKGGDRAELLAAEGGPVLRPAADEMPPALAAAAEARRARLADERMRLLYVAMTRAETWLIVAGAGKTGTESGEPGWHEIVAEAMAASGAVPVMTPAGEGLRYDIGAPWAGAPLREAPAIERAQAALPPWAAAKALAPPAAGDPLSPSDLGGAKALPGEEGLGAEQAKRQGRLVHLLLERLPGLPAPERARQAEALLAGEAQAEALLAEAARVIDDPALAWLFAEGSLAEAAFAARLPELGGRQVVGAIDRLVVSPGLVRIVDYKTNALVPGRPEDAPEGILRQVGAYAAAMGQVFPGRKIEAAIFWTKPLKLMNIPTEIATAALGRAGGP